MAVLHLQFDVDSEVHPELHEMLCTIGSSRSQAERLRQLAATGLVWERLRLQAYGRMEVPDLAGALPPVSAGAAAPTGRSAAAAPRPPVLPQVDAAPAPPGDLADFVDLSDAVVLAPRAEPDAAPVEDRPAEDSAVPHDPVHLKGVEAVARTAAAPVLPQGDALDRLPLHEIRSALQELPVLTEVLGAAELPLANAAAAATHEGVLAAAAAGRGGSVPGGAQIHELAPARKAVPRTRLMRMKEKGLFKNE